MKHYGITMMTYSFWIVTAVELQRPDRPLACRLFLRKAAKCRPLLDVATCNFISASEPFFGCPRKLVLATYCTGTLLKRMRPRWRMHCGLGDRSIMEWKGELLDEQMSWDIRGSHRTARM